MAQLDPRLKDRFEIPAPPLSGAGSRRGSHAPISVQVTCAVREYSSSGFCTQRKTYAITAQVSKQKARPSPAARKTERAAPWGSRPANGAKRSGPLKSVCALCAEGIDGLPGRLESVFHPTPAEPAQMGWTGSRYRRYSGRAVRVCAGSTRRSEPGPSPTKGAGKAIWRRRLRYCRETASGRR